MLEKNSGCQEELVSVKNVSYLDGYRLLLTFSNGVRKIVDLENRLDFKPFRPLKDVAIFKKVRVERPTIVWPGDIDMDPETLYDLGETAEQLEMA